MVSDYNAFVKVGGNKLWMTIDTSTSTTWVMSMACFTKGCAKVKMFAGGFIPALPPGPFPIDLLEGGIFQILSMVGINGHTMVNAGASVVGAPFMFGILDLGTINPMSFNHTGTVGLAYWEENWPWQLLIIDPMLSLLDFQRCGSIFYPIPMAPVPIPKNFPMWAMPPMFPGGVTLKVAFFFGDTGGCYFVNGVPGQFARSSMKRVMIMPLPGIKFLSPSYMFMVTGLKVGGASVKPCLIPAMCRGVFNTGSFSVSGPLIPVLTMLQVVSAPLTCEHLEMLPSITFSLMGSAFKMDRQDYTILGWSFDSVQCMTAFTPMAQLIPGMDLWRLGDSFIRAFYLQIDIQPMRSAKLGKADQPFYEKNGCSGTSGVGPVAKYKPVVTQTAGKKGSDATASATKERGTNKGNMFWKRRQNWEDDLKGIEANRQSSASASQTRQDDCSPVEGGDGARFRSLGGRCVPAKHHPEMRRLRSSRPAVDGLLERHRDKIRGWRDGTYHGAHGEDDPDAWSEGPHGKGDVDSYSGQFFGPDAALVQRGGGQRRAAARLRGGTSHGALEPGSDGAGEAVDLTRPPAAAAAGGADDARRLRRESRAVTVELTAAELVDAVGASTPRELESADATHRALHGAFDVDGFLGGLMARQAEIDAAKAEEASGRGGRDAGDGRDAERAGAWAEPSAIGLDGTAWPNVSAFSREHIVALYRADVCSRPVPDGRSPPALCLPGGAGAGGEKADNRTVRLPSAVQRRLDGMSGGMWSLPSDVRDWVIAKSPATAPHLHADAHRAAAGGPAAAAAASEWMRVHTAVAFVESQAMQARTRRERLKLGVEPAEGYLPPLRGPRAAPVTDEARGRASDPGAWAPHQDPFYRALGYGRASCAHKHHDFDPASRTSDRHGLSYTRGGDLIGCSRDGEPVVLPALLQETSTPQEEADMVRNMSAVMKHIESALNISDATTRLYWRGESEDFLLREARRWLVRYRRQIEQAQETAGVHKILSRQHKEVLRAYVMRQGTDPAQVLSSIRAVLARMGDGSVVDVSAPSDVHGGAAGAALARMMRDGSPGDGRLRSHGSSDPGTWKEHQAELRQSDWDRLEEVRHLAAPEGSLRAAGGGTYPFVDTPEIKDMEEQAAREAVEEAVAAARDADLDASGEATRLLGELLRTAAAQRGARARREAEAGGGPAVGARLVRGDDGTWRMARGDGDAGDDAEATSLLQSLGRGRFRSLRTLDEGPLARVAVLEALEVLHGMHEEALDEHVASLERQLRAAEADLARSEAEGMA